MNQNALNIIMNRLPEIEIEHDIKIIYAIESGSRAWGFESIDSDYDVRFIYKHNFNWYLNILPKREVIEYPIIDLFDYSGWDIRKTLFLLNKSNPVLFEWLKSPIVYFKDEKSFNLLNELAPLYFSQISTIYHYLHMASKNYRLYLQEDYVKVKKYFYVLRPLLACMWVETKNESPPMEFDKLIEGINLYIELVKEIKDLLIRKRNGIELGLEPKKPIINNFIENKINHFQKETKYFDPKKKPDSKILDEYFINLITSCSFSSLVSHFM